MSQLMNTVGECIQPVTDPGIETLSEVFDAAALAKHLRGAYLGQWNGAPIDDVRVVRVLKHHVGSRCTLEIGWRTDSDWHFLVGKVYSNDRPDILEAMERIQRTGFGPRDEFSIPQPLAYLPSLRLFLQEKVEGPVAKEIFKTGGDPSRFAAAERCALWLARFHAFGPTAGPVSNSEQCLTVLRKRTRRIAKLKGRSGMKAARLLEWLEEAAGALRPVAMCAGHGSYSPAQVILADGRTVTFDWDGYDVADPARDVGRFLYALRRWALEQLGSVRALDKSAEIFLNTYRAVGSPTVEANLLFYKVAACLKLVRTEPLSPHVSDVMLDEGLNLLGLECAL
jgi:hypothetical protein